MQQGGKNPNFLAFFKAFQYIVHAFKPLFQIACPYVRKKYA